MSGSRTSPSALATTQSAFASLWQQQLRKGFCRGRTCGWALGSLGPKSIVERSLPSFSACAISRLLRIASRNCADSAFHLCDKHQAQSSGVLRLDG